MGANPRSVLPGPVGAALRRLEDFVRELSRRVDAAGTGGGGGAVSSVFARTGAVVAATGDYTAAQVTGAVADTRQIIAGTGLTGGGTLAADRTLTVAYGTSGTTACVGNDARLSDARNPTLGRIVALLQGGPGL